MNTPTQNESAAMSPILLTINPAHVGKLAKDSPQWGAFNRGFAPAALDAHGILSAIQHGHAISALHHTKRHTSNFQGVQHMGLDFDTEDERSTLDALQAHPWLSQHGAIFHTTSSHRPAAPRARVLLLLDKPIADAKQYARYVEALHWWLGLPIDGQCKDAVRVWFGALDCEGTIYPERRLPVAVLDSILANYEAHQTAQRAQVEAERHARDTDPTIDPAAALDAAVRRAATEPRNPIGFWLACQLRDGGLCEDEAWAVMWQYFITVENIKGHEYKESEARASLRSAFSRPPRGHSEGQVRESIDRFEMLGWAGYGIQRGVAVYRYRMVAAIAAIMDTAGRTQELHLSVREFAKHGVKRGTAENHLRGLCAAGLLVQVGKAKNSRANRYSLNLDVVGEAFLVVGQSCKGGIAVDCPTIRNAPGHDITQLETYRALADYAHFQRGARIDGRLWPIEWGEPSNETFGETALRILAAMDEGNYESKSELAKRAKVSAATLTNKIKLLEALGMSDCEEGENSAHIPYLLDNWHERLIELAPALTTYGHDVLLPQQADKERKRFHAKMAEHMRREDYRIYCEERSEAAVERMDGREQQLLAYRAQRRAWCESHGLDPDAAPSISLQGEPREQTGEVARVNGRNLAPRQQRKSRVFKTMPKTTDAMRWERLRQLSGRDLTDREQAECHELGRALDVPILIERTRNELNP